MKIFVNKVSRLLNAPMLILGLFVALCILMAIGQSARWDLLDQVSMADNFIRYGSLYPSANDSSPHGVSVYFPGVAFLMVMLGKIGADFFLVELALLLSCLIVFLFFYVQMKIAESILDSKIHWHDFLPFIIAFSLIITPHWLIYALEFKPDTIALLTGFLGLYLAGGLVKNVSLLRLVLGSFVFGISIVFKQQYIAFIFGIYAFCIVFPTRERLIFSCISFLTLLAFLILSFRNSNMWFWNVIVLSDDPFLGILEILKLNLSSFKVLVFACIIGGLLFSLSGVSSPLFDKDGFRKLVNTPWIWGAAAFCLASFFSAFKSGGNSGNTELGIFLMVPIFFGVVSSLPRIVFISLALGALFFSLPEAVNGLLKYSDAKELRAHVSNDLDFKSGQVLTGSDVYFASRNYPADVVYLNYWSVSLRDNTDVTRSLKSLLPDTSSDRLVVENWPENRVAILNDSRYQIFFENDLGIIAHAVK